MLQVRTHCGHISDMYPPPVVFPATREVMEGYKTVSRDHHSSHSTATAPPAPLQHCSITTSVELLNIYFDTSPFVLLNVPSILKKECLTEKCPNFLCEDNLLV